VGEALGEGVGDGLGDGCGVGDGAGPGSVPPPVGGAGVTAATILIVTGRVACWLSESVTETKVV